MRVLIVDDDIPTVEAILGSIRWQALGVSGVDTAYSVAQARKILADGQTDIMLSDIEMPQGSGLDLLSWIRAQGFSTECLFLTCHERFDYAASAIKLDAAEYLTKPFDAGVMEMSLRRIIAKVKEKKRVLEHDRLDEWRVQNRRREELGFWLSLFSATSRRDEEQLERELNARALGLSAHTPLRLVAARVTEYERSMTELGQELVFYILENAFSRHLCHQEENRRVVRRFGGGDLWLLVAADDMADDELKRRCGRAIQACADTARLRVTCCCASAAPLSALSDKPDELQALVAQNVSFFGQAFLETEAVATDVESAVIEVEKLRAMLNARDKVSILNTVKEALAGRAAMRTLSERTLYLAQQELLQAVYAYLAQTGVSATLLFHEESAIRLSDQACRSVTDLLRYANYLLERAFTCENEARRVGTLVERVDAYLLKHYREDIGRAELAEEFHLAPEYLTKLYKRRTGKAFKDTLREIRMEQAKRLLRDPDVLVSAVAAEVGYDNFSYFSTLFKKETGVTPQEYRRG